MRRPRLIVDNRTRWDTGDLYRFFQRGLIAMGVRRETYVYVVRSPVRSRGCAEVGTVKREARVIVIAIAGPSYSSPREFHRRLARLFEHEVAHKKGKRHEDMAEQLRYSEGRKCLSCRADMADWSRGMRIRYRRSSPKVYRKRHG